MTCIILEAVKTVKICNLSMRQAALELNMNYCVLSDYCKNS